MEANRQKLSEWNAIKNLIPIITTVPLKWTNRSLN